MNSVLFRPFRLHDLTLAAPDRPFAHDPCQGRDRSPAEPPDGWL